MPQFDGSEMYNWCAYLFPLNRSLTGNGVRESLSYLKSLNPGLQIKEVASGTKAFDWVIPKEWNVSEAWVEDPSGKRIIDFKKNNLHLMGYSVPIECELELEDLLPHLHSLPELPHAIPYLTSYYKEDWGFCVTHDFLEKLVPGMYRVKIDSKLAEGHMTYGELLLPGQTSREILLTSYICHPSMANNELSGLAVVSAIARDLANLENRKYTYRILLIPETIGSIYYISTHLDELRKNVIAGWVLTCIGDNRAYSYLPSKFGNALTDRVARAAFHELQIAYKEYSWLERGSDERQFNSPGVDLPIGSIMRSKYGEYPEYHTSLDDMSVISGAGLFGGYKVIQKALAILEHNETYKVNVLCEPKLSDRGLYPEISTRNSYFEVANLMNVISFLDGTKDLIEISEVCGISFSEVYTIILKLLEFNLVEKLK